LAKPKPETSTEAVAPPNYFDSTCFGNRIESNQIYYLDGVLS